MADYPIHIGWSRAAILLDVGTNPDYGTPLQLQLELTSGLEREQIDPEDPAHPANQGKLLEDDILVMGGQVLAKRLGKRIVTIHCSPLCPPTPEDPIGGIVVYHPTEPCYARPDGFYLCPELGYAWLVDAKRYGKCMDQRVAKLELLAQLHGMLECLLAAGVEAGDLYDGEPYQLQDLTFAAVLRFGVVPLKDDDGQWGEPLITMTPDLLEVPTDAATRQGLVSRISSWMQTYVLPWWAGEDVPTAQPICWEDLCLRWPEPKPGKEVCAADDPALSDLIDQHSALYAAVPVDLITVGMETEIDEASGLERDVPVIRRMTQAEIDKDLTRLRTEIFMHLDARQAGDAECIVNESGGPAIATLPRKFGNRGISYAVKGYNKERKKALKNREKV